MKEFLDVADLAARWHTTAKAIYAQHHRRQLPPAHRIGRRLLWARGDVEAFEAQRREHHDDAMSRRRTNTSTSRRATAPADYPWLRAVP